MITLTFHVGKGYSAIAHKNTFADIQELERYLDNQFDYLVRFAEDESFDSSSSELELEAQLLWNELVEAEKIKRADKSHIEQLKSNIKYSEQWFADLATTFAKRQEELYGYRAQLEAAELAYKEKYND